MAKKSNLDLVNECDNFPYYSDDPENHTAKIRQEYVKFKISGYKECLGYVPLRLVEKLSFGNGWYYYGEGAIVFGGGNNCLTPETISKRRNETFAKYLENLRGEGLLKVLDGWRDELYPIYGPNKQLILSMERSATPLFGVVTYGVHMTAYVRTEQGMKIWAPRRAETKQTYPGMMDNTVAGGLSTGEDPFECLIREAQEEASLPEKVVRSAISCGTLTYFHVRDARAGGETGLCQPECQYLYDLELSPDVIPKPDDNEAIDFQLLSIDEVQRALADGKFKPNCALVLLEFFVRHGILTPENEPDYIEIVSRLHRKLEFPMR